MGQLVGGQLGQNDQKLHENYKITIFGSKQWRGMGRDKPIFQEVEENLIFYKINNIYFTR